MQNKTTVVSRSMAALLLLGTLLPGSVRASASPSTEPSSKPEAVALERAERTDETAAEQTAEPLAGTRWQLVEFQSMSDEIGTIAPDDPSQFTMELNPNGSVTMRLDCNFARGTWSATSVEGDRDRFEASGSFELGPLVMTNALCEPPNLDEQFARHAEFVRSYVIADGRLFLSLMADGGIYVWEPVSDLAAEAVQFEADPDPELEAAILDAFPDYTRDVVEVGGDARLARYLYNRVDLNADGTDEVLVYLLGSFFCGTGGCNLLLFSETEDGYTLIDTFPTTRTPVILSSDRSAGWHDLIRLQSGGGMPPSYVRHEFDGDRYVEVGELPVEPEPEGTPYLVGEFEFADGILLEPQD